MRWVTVIGRTRDHVDTAIEVELGVINGGLEMKLKAEFAVVIDKSWILLLEVGYKK